ncbi:FdhE protein [Evansella vedderi]|uniref:FdhE protein n=1 Tax=Evansella vedderi TaxID=38282 RepID=A0ABT9ZUF7_9BACI|nr:formate dehydrogenase accessory protein FdhE [Evansella vedderi]MDQ0254880.1 FdhE protein [Evansella vedderi]
MNPNVVSEDYLLLQKGIMEEQSKIKERIEAELQLEIKKDDLNLDIPVLPQLPSTPVPANLYKEAVITISTFLKDQSKEIEDSLIQVVSDLKDEQLVDWVKASIKFDTEYFHNFAQNNALAPWLPHFIAEQAIRPFLQLISSKCVSFIQDVHVMGTCPCCGEPPRLAKLENKGQKILYCPRCETQWEQKRLSCVHCGNDNHENLFYIGVQEDETSKIEVCKSCRNYIKLIDTKKTFLKKQAGLLDLETLHLDFVAQEEGYGDESH